MPGQIVQCGGCRIDVQVVRSGDGVEAVRCPACAKTAPKDDAIEAARSHLIDFVMRDLSEDLRDIVRSNPSLGYRPAPRYDWVLDGM